MQLRFLLRESHPTFVRTFNHYWDAGRKGLLSGESLYFDLKRMEMAYLDNNKRELELIRHVSLRQLDPVALLTLKSLGSCQVTLPEWIFDLDCPGPYRRRIKSVALSIPSDVGPYTSVNCTLSLLKSSVRKSSIAGDEYARQRQEDDRFVDYIGAIQSIVTSSAQNDNGMFETNLRDERFLPFEGAGALSTWKLDLPIGYRTFDYSTISDLILQIRYTARQGLDPVKMKAALDDLFQQAGQSNLALLFSLPHDFPGDWSRFVSGKGDFTTTIPKEYFPYFTQNQKKSVAITRIELYGEDVAKPQAVGDQSAWDAQTTDLGSADKQAFTVTIPAETLTADPKTEILVVVRYTMS